MARLLRLTTEKFLEKETLLLLLVNRIHILYQAQKVVQMKTVENPEGLGNINLLRIWWHSPHASWFFADAHPHI